VVALASAASVGAQWPGTRSSGPDNCLPSESFEKYSQSDHAKTESLLRQFQHLQLSTPGAESYLEQLQQHRYRVYAEELSKMQAGGKKCELEALYSFGLEFICAFLERCILSEDYI
jgi:DNA topoisomerase VI subunit A